MKVRWNLEGYVDAVFKADLGGDGFQEQVTSSYPLFGHFWPVISFQVWITPFLSIS